MNKTSMNAQSILARRHFGSLIVAIAMLLLPAISRAATLPTNNDPANQIRFTTAADADARRERLIKYIWSDGLPATLPEVSVNVAIPSQAVDINPLNVARVDRLESNVSGWDFHMQSYLIHPANPLRAKRVVLVQQGHSGILIAGVGATANHLLQNGFTVIVLELPLYGWNTDRTAIIPGRGTLVYQNCSDIILNTAENCDGKGFRLFLEPVVQAINYVSQKLPGIEDISMIGLSGGGWYTQMMSAIDPRIKLSVPVAGSSPLYHRNRDSRSVGCPEQYYAPLFDENIAADGTGGGIATWLEIYSLGAYGPGRKQIQVSNEFDACCFSGNFADSYKEIVSDKVKSLGSGEWAYVRDSSHNAHQISPHTIKEVIDPLFGISSPLPAPSGLPLHDDFNNQSNEFPYGWTLDKNSAQGGSALENDGGLTLSGSSIAIFRNRPFNPQRARPIVVEGVLADSSADCICGFTIAGNASAKSPQLGISIAATTGEIALTVDSGEGLDVARERTVIGTISDYRGGPITLTMSVDSDGYLVKCFKSGAVVFESATTPWSTMPKAFDPKSLGDSTSLFLTCSSKDKVKPAVARFDSISINNAGETRKDEPSGIEK
ncbi:MAG: hypothetical protein IT427_03205 [Pirellulales bacterium]|nr:hypothetical protein [Pirellulales bacterium]